MRTHTLNTEQPLHPLYPVKPRSDRQQPLAKAPGSSSATEPVFFSFSVFFTFTFLYRQVDNHLPPSQHDPKARNERQSSETILYMHSVLFPVIHKTHYRKKNKSIKSRFGWIIAALLVVWSEVQLFSLQANLHPMLLLSTNSFC